MAKCVLVPLLCVAAACGSSTASPVQGAGSFTPNAVNAVRFLLPDGGIEQDAVWVDLTDSSPAIACTSLDGGFPDSGIFEGEVAVFIGQSPSIKAGTMSITDEGSFFVFTLENGYPETGVAFVGLAEPTTPLSSQARANGGSVSGTLTLTKVGDEWAGDFSATMVIGDGGPTPLSGSFDTSSTCYSAD